MSAFIRKFLIHFRLIEQRNESKSIGSDKSLATLFFSHFYGDFSSRISNSISNRCCDCTNCRMCSILLHMLIDLMASCRRCRAFITFSNSPILNHDLPQILLWTCPCHSSPTSFRQFHRQPTPKTSENRFRVILTRRRATAARVTWWTRQLWHRRNSERLVVNETSCPVKFVGKPSTDRVSWNDTCAHTQVSCRDQSTLKLLMSFESSSDKICITWLTDSFIPSTRWKATRLRSLRKRIQHIELVKHSSTHSFGRETSR